MGTSGNRPGNKVFSISTTVRNPQRNIDFLEAFKPFVGLTLTNDILYKFMFELVKKGIYQFNKLSEEVKTKLDLDIELTDEEVKEAIKNNPQATGQTGRIMTWLRGLKDQGFLSFENTSDGEKIEFTSFGTALLENSENATNIYTKIMLGMHANNPTRPAMHNKARPFLNTVFVINEVNKLWSAMGHTPKGILRHEFAYFVLSMKDCDYSLAANEIIEYRKKYRFEPNQAFAENYLKSKGMPPVSEGTLLRDYTDDVFKKFAMTELLVKHGKFNYMYIDFSKYNLEKIKVILDSYKDYKFETFKAPSEYINFLENIEIPWEKNEGIRKKIVETKMKVLGITINEDLPLSSKEEMLDRMFYSSALARAVDNTKLSFIFKELLILSGLVKEKTNLGAISEPLRLEYLLTLALGKIYGVDGLVSNIIYNEDGFPLHCAPGGKCDIQYICEEGSYILEPTMQRSKAQQNNNETTSIARHVRDEYKKNKLKYRVAMVAPAVHTDVVDYFVYASDRNKVSMITVSINVMVALFESSNTITKLNESFDIIFNKMMESEFDEFADLINKFKPEVNLA